MTRTSQIGRPNGAAADFQEARLAAEEAGAVQQRQAAQRVAEHSHDAQDCRDLLAMLGLADLQPRDAHPVLDANPVRDEPANVTFPEALGVYRTTEGVAR
ncbi:hypothetical protein [Lentzea albida]|uniref:Uncharacterized protein n=1 Tax=Lentzea albida TaxID=65499 RepID=A0A1H9V7P9_9PSEU|nr:hypothetical protein [Lentzea albida]SES17571.1 hypothetical protein SAMN04488000_11788 [Lentzea albida]